MCTSSVSKKGLACSAAVLLGLFSRPLSAQLACDDQVNISLDANGMAMLSPEHFVAEASPGANLKISPSVVSCAHISLGLIDVTVTDLETHDSCWGTLYVNDKLPPTPVCLPDAIVQLDEEGLGSLDPADIDVDSFDNCSPTPTFSLDRSEFTCDDVGPQDVKMDVIDDFQNQDFCQVSVNVIESAACTGADCVKNPNRAGYWFIQCLALNYDKGGLGWGLYGNQRHKRAAEDNFAPELIDAVGDRLDGIFGQSGLSACQDGMKVDWKYDSCDRALRQLTTLLFNIESGRLTEICPVCLGKPAIRATTIGELVNEIAGYINAGECSKALKIASKIQRGRGLECD